MNQTQTTHPTHTTVIAPGTSISGSITLQGPASILGSIEGSIQASGKLDIGHDATVNAEVQADAITLDGHITGNVNASDRLELSASAVLQGDVNAKTLIVSEGASFTGHCRVGSNAAATTNTAQLAEPKPQTQHQNNTQPAHLNDHDAPAHAAMNNHEPPLQSTQRGDA